MSRITNIRTRRDSSTNWTTTNPILANGEFGLETGRNILKVGDGTRTWNNLPYINASYSKVKTVSETKTANTTFANDASLTHSMLANEVYTFSFFISAVSSGTAPDLKIQFAGPAGATVKSVVSRIAPTTAVVGNLNAFATPITAIALTTTPIYLIIEGSIINGSTAGTFALQWAQNTSSAQTSTIELNSSLEMSRVQ